MARQCRFQAPQRYRLLNASIPISADAAGKLGYHCLTKWNKGDPQAAPHSLACSRDQLFGTNVFGPAALIVMLSCTYSPFVDPIFRSVMKPGP